MGRFLHEQACVITCTGAQDIGDNNSGVEQYVIFALRADTKESSAPADTQDNYENAVEIGRLSNLSQIPSWNKKGVKGVYDYDSTNEYKFKWYGWESGYNYRFWTFGVDKAGNIELKDWDDHTYNTVATDTPLVDSLSPQFVVKSNDDVVEYTNHIKGDLTAQWSFSRSSDELTITNDDAPQWSEDLTNKLIHIEGDSYEYWLNIASNSVVSSQDVIQVDSGFKQDISTGAVTLSDYSELPASGDSNMVVVDKISITCGIGSMKLEYNGVDPEVADLDHYKIERFVTNDNDLTGTTFNFNNIIDIEDTKYTDFNLVWDKNDLDNTYGLSDSSGIYPTGLYKVTPVDKYGNEGFGTLSWSFTNLTVYQPSTGTPPADFDDANVHAVGNLDGDIQLHFNKISDADYDLKGFQIARRRGEYSDTGSDQFSETEYDWNSWEIITSSDIEDFESSELSGYTYKYRDVGLDPFDPANIGYQYKIRGFDHSGNTSLNWHKFDDDSGNVVILAQDEVVDTTGSGLSAVGKLGSINLTITQPSDNKSIKAHLYRRRSTETSFEETPFKVVWLPEEGDVITQDELPPTDEEWQIFYKVAFEDKWGNISDELPVGGISAISKTARTAVDSIPPHPPLSSDIDIIWDENLPGSVSGVEGNSFITYSPSGSESPGDYLEQGDKFKIIDFDGNGNDQVFEIDSISSNTINILTSLDVDFSGKTLNYNFEKVEIDYLPPINSSYFDGTVSVTADSTTVTGSSTSFDTDFMYNGNPRKVITIDGDDLFIESITSTTELELANPYPGATASGLDYSGSPDYKEAILFKRRVGASDVITVTASDSKNITKMFDTNPIVGSWEYGLTFVDTYNNENDDITWASTQQVDVADTIAPTAPEDLSVFGGYGRITFEWSRPAAEDIDHYDLIVKNQDGIEEYNVSNIYSESYTLYNLTENINNIAKRLDYDGSEKLSNYWKFQVIVYDFAGNSSTSTFVDLDERDGSGQTAYLDNYQPSSGTVPTSSANLLSVLNNEADYPKNGYNGDIWLKLDYSAISSDESEIEKLVLERAKSDDSSPTRVKEIFPVNNSFSGLPDSIHDTELLDERNFSASDQFKYRLLAVSYQGKVRVGTYTSSINCTDTTGPNISSGANVDIKIDVGSANIKFVDVINRDSALYEIWRSPSGSFDNTGTNCEKIGTVQSSRSSQAETLKFFDYDWTNITGVIPNEKTILADDSYSDKIAYYRIVGVDRFGNRYSPDSSGVAKYLVSGSETPVSSQWFRPTLSLDENGYFLLPFDNGIGSTRGHYPDNVGIPQVSIRPGRFGNCASFEEINDFIHDYSENGFEGMNNLLKVSDSSQSDKDDDNYFSGSFSNILNEDLYKKLDVTSGKDYLLNFQFKATSGDTLIAHLDNMYGSNLIDSPFLDDSSWSLNNPISIVQDDLGYFGSDLVDICPVEAITYNETTEVTSIDSTCIACGACVAEDPTGGMEINIEGRPGEIIGSDFKVMLETDSNSIEKTLTGLSGGDSYLLSFYATGSGGLAGSYSVYNNTDSSYIVTETSTSVTGDITQEVTDTFTLPAGCSSITVSFIGPGSFDKIELKKDLSSHDDYSQTFTAPDDLWNNYEMIFHSGENLTETDIVFSASATSNIDNIYLIESIASNGDFSDYTGTLDDGTEDTFSDWTLREVSEDAEYYAVSDSPEGFSQSLKYVQATAPDSRYHHAINDEINFSSGKDYKISFYAKADSNSTIRVVDDTSSVGNLNQDVDLTTSWQQFSFIWTANTNSANANFWFGDDAVTKYITGISIVELSSDYSSSNKVLKYDAIYSEDSNGNPIKGVNTNAFTIDFMVKHDWDWDDSEAHYLVRSSGGLIRITKHSDNNLYGVVSDGSSNHHIDISASDFIKDTWHRITMTWDSTSEEIKLYLNGSGVGTQDSSGTFSLPSNWGDYLYVGGDDSNNPGDVRIDNLSIHNVARTEEEIKTWYYTDKPFVDEEVVLLKTCPEKSTSGTDHIISYSDSSNTREVDVTQINKYLGVE